MNKNTPLNTGMHPDLKVEVAVIGAGTSGLYSAYRLVTDKKFKAHEIQIFDMNDKLGGRLESVIMPGMNFWGELGGMRYLTSQEIVTTLIEGYPSPEDPTKRIPVLKDVMTPVPFPMGDPTKLLMYLRKERFKQDAWNVAQGEGKKLPTRYYLNEGDIGFSSDQLFNKIIHDVLMADPWVASTYGSKIKGTSPLDYSFELDSRDWDDVKPKLVYNFPNSPYDGRKVNDIGFWNLIKDQVSQEGYEFLANAGGYYSNTINWNSAEAFPYMVGDFSAGTIYKTIEEGYDSIAYAVANAYMEHEGACIWSENKLLTFTKEHALTSSHKYQLTFLNLKTNKQWKVYANQLILAMPRKSLELLDQNNFFFNANENSTLNYNIRSVIMEPAFKILMGFEYPWWKEPELEIDSGHSITDLPMRQCYYFGTDPQTNNSMLLGSYGDMETETFWKALTDDKILFEVKPAKSASLKELHELDDVQATKLMVGELMNQLRELHGDKVTIPEPYVTYFKDWTDDPFGAGYHAWKAGYSVKNVMPYMRKPVADEQIHICGEAYSDQQGWVEGAFCEAEKMLQEYFGLDRPYWLSEKYYLGW
ncbi:FAD-dependent oxidoreductase [Chryseobacterium sp. JUb7]|uniref:flavin monoamine oxidase family protein n=1 Tax=Chryseobacterium sp. JUb7 TaxID=2940599 RepID=UPI0021678460|nr:oleate hydratase [Chryseobacterium sp. JUb7]MCS3528658.1 monoamine oxidase [Chryseobacterium sp. JUb7]